MPPTSSTCCSTAPAGRDYLADRKSIGTDVIDVLGHFGFSSTCNVLAAIKTAKLLDLGADDAIVTVATDGGAMYPSERAKTLAARFGGDFDAVDAGEVFGEHLADVTTEHTIECTEADRRRIFNLGYYTWVEQQGTPFELFEAAPRPGVLARPAPLRRRVGRDDHRLQRTRRGSRLSSGRTAMLNDSC